MCTKFDTHVFFLLIQKDSCLVDLINYFIMVATTPVFL
jgi:hypothetical protein